MTPVDQIPTLLAPQVASLALVVGVDSGAEVVPARVVFGPACIGRRPAVGQITGRVVRPSCQLSEARVPDFEHGVRGAAAHQRRSVGEIATSAASAARDISLWSEVREWLTGGKHLVDIVRERRRARVDVSWDAHRVGRHRRSASFDVDLRTANEELRVDGCWLRVLHVLHPKHLASHQVVSLLDVAWHSRSQKSVIRNQLLCTPAAVTVSVVEDSEPSIACRACGPWVLRLSAGHLLHIDGCGSQMTRIDGAEVGTLPVRPRAVQQRETVAGARGTCAVHGCGAVDTAGHVRRVEAADESGGGAGVHVHADAGAIALVDAVDGQGGKAGVGVNEGEGDGKGETSGESEELHV